MKTAILNEISLFCKIFIKSDHVFFLMFLLILEPTNILEIYQTKASLVARVCAFKSKILLWTYSLKTLNLCIYT